MKIDNHYTAAFFLLPVFVFSSFVRVHAQSTSREVFEKAIVADFCDTFTKASPHFDKDNMTLQMGMMILPLFTKYQSEIKAEWGLSATNKNDMRGMGERVGQLAAINCPAFREFVSANLKEIADVRDGVSHKTYAGKLVKLEGTSFPYLTVQNQQGKLEKLYWMEYFEGADKLTSQWQVYLNKPISITYKEVEVYQPLQKEYKVIKVITRAQF